MTEGLGVLVTYCCVRRYSNTQELKAVLPIKTSVALAQVHREAAVLMLACALSSGVEDPLATLLPHQAGNLLLTVGGSPLACPHGTAADFPQGNGLETASPKPPCPV